MTDPLFADCVSELIDINVLMPDLRFGEVVQAAADLLHKRKNVDVSSLSTKECLTALKQYSLRERTKRGIN
jgi:hypothetical protein